MCSLSPCIKSTALRFKIPRESLHIPMDKRAQQLIDPIGISRRWFFKNSSKLDIFTKEIPKNFKGITFINFSGISLVNFMGISLIKLKSISIKEISYVKLNVM